MPGSFYICFLNYLLFRAFSHGSAEYFFENLVQNHNNVAAHLLINTYLTLHAILNNCNTNCILKRSHFFPITCRFHMTTSKTEYVDVLLMGGCILFGKQGKGFVQNLKQMRRFDCMIVYQSHMKTRVRLRTRRVFTAAADNDRCL